VKQAKPSHESRRSSRTTWLLVVAWCAAWSTGCGRRSANKETSDTAGQPSSASTSRPTAEAGAHGAPGPSTQATSPPHLSFAQLQVASVQTTDGTEPHIVVVYSDVAGERSVHLAAYDRNSFERVWMKKLRGSEATRPHLVGQRILVHHRSWQVHAYDLRDGSYISSSTNLSAHVDGFCGKGSSVHVLVSDGHNVTIDPLSLEMRPSKEYCWSPDRAGSCESRRDTPKCGESGDDFFIAGEVVDSRWRGRTTDLLPGYEYRGSKTPFVLGVTPGSVKVKWKWVPEERGAGPAAEGESVDVWEEGAIFRYRTPDGEKIVGLDPNTGAIRWRQSGGWYYSRIGARGFLHDFVHPDNIRVIDLGDGKLLGTLRP